jgi:hypothetical protein
MGLLIFLKKWVWATFWAIFSQTHLVALAPSQLEKRASTQLISSANGFG